MIKLAVLILIVLLATSLRWHQLDADSLWGDEVVEGHHAQRDRATILVNNPLALRSTLTHLFSRIGGHDVLEKLIQTGPNHWLVREAREKPEELQQ